MMNTRLTLADVRTALGRDTFKPTTFMSEVNRITERLLYMGKYKGAIIRVTFDSSTGFITLPRYYLSVIGSTYNHWPVPIFGEFHTYFESGPGTPLEASSWLGQLQDLGDGYCTQVDITEANPRANPAVEAQPGSVLLYSTGSDNGKTVRLYGIQQETGLPVTDDDGDLGEAITLNAPFVTSKFHYTKLTDVQKAVTNGPVTAWVAPTAGGTPYQIATWQPGETRPRYRRYKTGRAESAIQVLCQRRFVPVLAETDWVIPGNLAALEFGIKALNHENVGFTNEARDNWADALRWLNEEATASRGGAQPSVPVGVGYQETIPHQH